MENWDGNFKHDINRGLCDLRVAPDLLLPNHTRARRSGRPGLEAKRLHQGWRYGMMFDDADERKAVQALVRIKDWIVAEMRYAG
ncbi:MAG: hypothetical protein M1598_00795, partial [Actinobacteria bacterium]|nr:hypothetical protein [Actinomycetota bacterium]